MQLIAITNQKGGSGKTTTAVNLAAALAERGQSVLLVDLDPQANATDWLGQQAGRELIDAHIDGPLAPHIRYPVDIVDGVDLIPSSQWMVGLERRLASEVGAEQILTQRLAELGDSWDWVLIDCPPALGLITLNALCAVPELLVPVETHILALHGLAQLVETVTKVQTRLNPALTLRWILPCRADFRTLHSRQIIEQMRGMFGETVTRTVIRENVRLAEAPGFRLPITAYDPRSTGAADYRSLALEIIKGEKND